MSKEFDIEALENDEQMMIDELPHADPARSSALDDTLQSDVEMTESEIPEASSVVVNLEPLNSKDRQNNDDWVSDDSAQGVEGNQQWSTVTKRA